MNSGTTVPFLWLVGVACSLGAAIVAAFLWWLRTEFARIHGQQTQFSTELTKVHRRMDFLIVKLLGKSYDEIRAEDSGT